MRAPVYVRPLTDAEQQIVQAGLRSSDAFTLRRCQILLASADGQRVPQIARTLGCDDQTVLNAIRAFTAVGVDCLTRGSPRPHHVPHAACADRRRERLRDLLHQSPRAYGQPTSVWTLALAAEVSFEQGLTATRVSHETIRAALRRLGVGWRRAKRWITSPDPEYQRKKHARDRLLRLIETHPDWALGYEDEVWWSRLAQPNVHTWTEPNQRLRLLDPAGPADDPDPKALACYGLLTRWVEPDGQRHERMLLRFVDGRPVSAITMPFLAWCCARLAALGKRALLLVWDNASWHGSKAVRGWIRAHNRHVRHSGTGVRIVVCFLPSKSPWLNAIEPKWVHGKRRVIEADRVLPAQELADRVCETYGCVHEPHLSILEKAA
jgi:transposase